MQVMCADMADRAEFSGFLFALWRESKFNTCFLLRVYLLQAMCADMAYPADLSGFQIA
jgi:hypothetical protein